MVKERLSSLQGEILAIISQTVNKHNIKDVFSSTVRGEEVMLKRGVIDLRDVILEIARWKRETYYWGFIWGKFQVSFSRSIKNLIKKKLLKAYHGLLPLDNNDFYEDHLLGDSNIQLLSDGYYLNLDYKRVRFVSMINKKEKKQ